MKLKGDELNLNTHVLFQIGIVHCQILEGKFMEAKQQLDFQSEVTAGSQAVRNLFEPSKSVEYVHLFLHSKELTHLRAILAKRENILAPAKILALFDLAAEQHFKNLRVCSNDRTCNRSKENVFLSIIGFTVGKEILILS